MSNMELKDGYDFKRSKAYHENLSEDCQKK
jgi:hypothetical protein